MLNNSSNKIRKASPPSNPSSALSSDDEFYDAEEYCEPTSVFRSVPPLDTPKPTTNGQPQKSLTPESSPKRPRSRRQLSRTLPRDFFSKVKKSHGEKTTFFSKYRFNTMPLASSSKPGKHVTSPLQSAFMISEGPEEEGSQSSTGKTKRRSHSVCSSSSSSATVPSISADFDPNMVRDLDTGESMHIDKANKSVELTWKKYEASRANSVHSSSEDAKDVDLNDVKIRKQGTGWFGKVFFRQDDTEPAPRYDVNTKSHHKNNRELAELKRVQEINIHEGPIWTMQFSLDGQFLATGGQDTIVRVWVVVGSQEYKKNMAKLQEQGLFPEYMGGPHLDVHSKPRKSQPSSPLPSYVRDVLSPQPFMNYCGHKSDVITLAWSKANFLLSGSMDRTVMLWHVSRKTCLCLFQHSDFVTAVSFHPVDDTMFLSGSFDKKLRLWNILEHRVVDWVQAPSMVTSATWSPNGDYCVAGLYNGRCIFYKTQGFGFKYFTEVECRNRRGKHSKGRKVTGLCFAPHNPKLLLITTNDSRIRLYDTDDYSLSQKYKGLTNAQLQISASFSSNGQRIICGSDDQHVYVWEAKSSYVPAINPGIFKPVDHKNESYEYFKASSEIVTVALFAPHSSTKFSQQTSDIRDEHLRMQSVITEDQHSRKIKHIVITSGYNGELKVFENRGEEKEC